MDNAVFVIGQKIKGLRKKPFKYNIIESPASICHQLFTKD